MNQKLMAHAGVHSEQELLRFLKTDIRRVTGRYVGPSHLCGAAGVGAVGRDFLGIVWKPKDYGLGTYNEIVFHPLAHVKTVREVDEYEWPSPDWFDMSHLKEEIKRINDTERYAILFFAGGAFETPWYMRGLERFLLDLVECPAIAEAIARHSTAFYKERAVRALEATDGMIDIIGSGGDIGTQTGMMLSPSLWRKHIKPYSTDLIKPFKEAGFKTFYHSDGSILPVIEDLIGMGLDILDPIQPKAAGMDPEFLKKQYGDRLSFHGGVDIQELLPFGTPAQIETEVKRLISVLGRNGGYIVSAAHGIQPDTPVENVLTLFRTVTDYRY